MAYLYFVDHTDFSVYRYDGATWVKYADPAALTFAPNDRRSGGIGWGNEDLPIAWYRNTAGNFVAYEIDPSADDFGALYVDIAVPDSQQDKFSNLIKSREGFTWITIDGSESEQMTLNRVKNDKTLQVITDTNMWTEVKDAGGNESNSCYGKPYYIFPFRDRLIASPWRMKQDSNDRSDQITEVPCVIYAFDQNFDGGTVASAPLVTGLLNDATNPAPHPTFIKFRSITAPISENPLPAMKDGAVFSFEFGGKLYFINFLGQCREIDVDASWNATLGSSLWSLQDDPNMKVAGLTTSANATGASLQSTNGTLPPWVIGGKFVIDPGGAATTYYGVSTHDGWPGSVYFKDDNGNDVPSVGNGVTFDFYHGLVHNPDNNSSVNANGPLHCFQAVTVGSKVYIFSASNISNRTYTPHRPFQVIEWDGVSAPNFYELEVAGGIPDCMGFNLAVEGTTIHIVLTNDIDVGQIIHTTWNTVNNTQGGENAFGIISDNQSIIRSMGIPNQCLLLVSANDPNVTFPSDAPVVVDNELAIATISYLITSPNSASVNVTIDYYKDDVGWTTATRKAGQGEGITGLTSSPTGVAHTFVHDVFADEGNYVGGLQYRVRAVQP